jgi:putative ABC transport system permease protein
MLWRLIRRSIRARPAPAVLAVLAVTAGAALAAALLGVAFEVRERMARELRAFGANILVVPRAEPLQVAVGGLSYVAPQDEAYLAESDLPALKTLFWRHNIVAVVPFLSRTVEVEGRRALLVGTWFDKAIRVPEGPPRFTFALGSREVAPAAGDWRTGVGHLAAWQVDGASVDEAGGGILVGRALAARLGVRPGAEVEVRAGGRPERFPVRGLLRTGGVEEDQMFVELGRAQALFGLPGRVEKVLVSALVTADNGLALRARRIGPDRLPPEEFETWYCTPYLDAITFQIEEALPGVRAKAIRRVAEAEGAFLEKLGLAFALVSAVALLASMLGVGASMARAILERRAEVGLMQALGAERRQIARLFLVEAAITGLAGAALGWLLGAGLAAAIGYAVFGSPIVPHPLILPAVAIVATVIALVGVLLPLRAVLRARPAGTLAGE